MMASAIDPDASLSVILPTSRYFGREEELEFELGAFLDDLLGGIYGPLQDKLILEIGSEYFAHFKDGSVAGAAQYGSLANRIVEQISSALEDPTKNAIGADLTIAVQSGKTLEDDAKIREELSNSAISEIDMIIQHRFSPQPQGFDKRIDDVETIRELWRAEAEAISTEEPELYLSAWNVATFTRQNALAEYLADHPELSENSIDHDGRTSTNFENYWQERLGEHSYGEDHPGAILEAFSSYAEVGMSAGAIFGVDNIHLGRLSWRNEQGEDFEFAGLDMLEMIYEAVNDTKVLASESDYDVNAGVGA